MKIWATVHYENTFLMEVPAKASPDEIKNLIFQKDENDSLKGDWSADYEVETEWEDEE